MKRYRVLAIDFDSRATVLTQEIKTEWEPHVREQWAQNKVRVREGLLAQYGSLSAEAKLENFIALGPLPMSVLAFHNKFHSQARDAFVGDAYYPALTGVCALGERVLNHLLLGLRGSFAATPAYKKVYRKQAFDDWEAAVSVLEAWGALVPAAVNAFGCLEQLRHRAIHFRPEVDTNDRDLALEAIQQFTTIVQEQFTAFGRSPWFIPGAKGASYIKKEWETNPFIRLVYLPSCVRVGPYHRLDHVGSRWKVIDPGPYDDIEVTDEEFLQRLEGGPPASPGSEGVV